MLIALLLFSPTGTLDYLRFAYTNHTKETLKGSFRVQFYSMALPQCDVLPDKPCKPVKRNQFSILLHMIDDVYTDVQIIKCLRVW